MKIRWISLASTAAILSLAGPASAQITPLLVPKGKLRVDILGQFQNWDHRYNDGTREEAAADFNRSTMDRRFVPGLGAAEDHLKKITGLTNLSLSLGKSTSSYLVNYGTTGFGGALGLTRRITLHGMVPIIAVKIEPRFLVDTTGGNATINPASLLAANPSAAAQTNAFLSQLSAALTTLRTRIAAGTYQSDPATELLAETTLARGEALQAELAALLQATDGYFTPRAGTDVGRAVQQVISDFQAQLRTLNITTFSQQPALLTSPFSADLFDTYLTGDKGPIASRSLTEVPALSYLGDVEIGVSFGLVDHFPSNRIGAGFRAVLDATVRLRTAKLDSPDRFMDLGTGDRQPDVDVSLVADYVAHRLGVRLSGGYNLQLPGNQNRRVSRFDAPIAPLATLAGVRRDPGDVIRVSAQPFFRLATYLSLFGSVDYWNKGRDKFTYAAGQPAIDGVDIGVLADGSASDALMLAGGISFSHSGFNKRGEFKLPMDASLRYQRIGRSRTGLVPDAASLRIDLRFYGRIFGR